MDTTIRPSDKKCPVCGEKMQTFNTGIIAWCSNEKCQKNKQTTKDDKSSSEPIPAQKVFTFQAKLNQENSVVKTPSNISIASPPNPTGELRKPSLAILYWMEESFTTLTVNNHFKSLSLYQYFKELTDWGYIIPEGKKPYNIYRITPRGKELQYQLKKSEEMKNICREQLKPWLRDGLQ